jgi:hypothetical protein
MYTSAQKKLSVSNKSFICWAVVMQGCRLCSSAGWDSQTFLTKVHKLASAYLDAIRIVGNNGAQKYGTMIHTYTNLYVYMYVFRKKK